MACGFFSNRLNMNVFIWNGLGYADKVPYNRFCKGQLETPVKRNKWLVFNSW